MRTCSRSASTCDTLASRLLVAGGGGGAGGATSPGSRPAFGGGWAGLFASGAGEDGTAEASSFSTGRLNRRSLPPGSYRLEAVAGEGELRSRPAAAAFRVVAK